MNTNNIAFIEKDRKYYASIIKYAPRGVLCDLSLKCTRIRKIFNYGKCPKNSNTLFHTILQLFLKILSGKANSVDPDQEQSDLGLHCLHVILSDSLVFEILGHLLYKFF